MNLPIGEKQLIEHVKREYQLSYDYTEGKRKLYKKRKKLYMNIEDQDKKIYSRLIFSTIETLLSLYVKSKPSVNFSVNGEFFDDVERTIKNIADSDFIRMGLEKKKERVKFHSFYYGVGIEVVDGFNQNNKTPETLVLSPMQWLCDPEASINMEDRFHGFELKADKETLTKERGYFNIDKLEAGEETDYDDDKEFGEKFRGISFAPTKDSGMYNIYHHYTTIKGKKYILTLGNNRNLLIRCEEITPKNDEQKKDPSLIKFPVVVRNHIETEFDRWGISVLDLLEDKQTMQQLFLNLNRIKAENEAWGDIFLYDPDIIENIDDITIPKIGPKYVKASGLNQGGTPMIEVPRGNIKSDAYNMPNVVKQQGFLDIGLDERSLGVSGGSPITATENQRVQANANLRQMLGLRRDARAEKVFWILWYEAYQECFFGKKKIKIPGRYGGRFFELSPSNFIVHDSIDVEIEYLLDIEEKNEKKKLEMMAMKDQFMNDPTKSPIAKAIFERELFKLQGFSQEKIDLFSEKTIEEEYAEMDLELLNRNEELGPITDMSENHLIYIEIYKRAKDTDAKYRAIEARREAQVIKKEQERFTQGQEMPGGDRQMKGQIVSSLMSQANSQPNNARSLSDLDG